MAQHLLVAADRFALARLRRICEGRLCETVEVRPCHWHRLPAHAIRAHAVHVHLWPCSAVPETHCCGSPRGMCAPCTHGQGLCGCVWGPPSQPGTALDGSVGRQPERRRAQVESVATTLALAEQNHAEELKRVCLEYVSKHLSLVIASEGYQHMVNSCPQLQVGRSGVRAPGPAPKMPWTACQRLPEHAVAGLSCQGTACAAGCCHL